MTDELSKMMITVSRYRSYLMKYLGLTKTQLLNQLANRMNKNEVEVHLKQITDIDKCSEILNELKTWKCELTGVRRLKPGNPKDLAKKDMGVFKMKVVEIFNSIDGEGIRAGELTTFIRLYGCNLRCDYCDTTYSYNQETNEQPWKEMSITEIIEECDKYNTDNITVTGGEPLIHLDIQYLLRALSEAGYNVNVETNGSISLDKYYTNTGEPNIGYENVWFTIDYKCNCSGMTDKMDLNNFNRDYRPYKNVVYKFVVGSEDDLIQAYTIITNHILHASNTRTDNCYIYLSPVFGKIDPKRIVEFMQEKNLFDAKIPIRCQLQIHKIIWDVNQRGV